MRLRQRARQSALAASSHRSRYGLPVSGQRARSAVTADHRSVHPNIPGVPWWGAVLIAVTATAIGFAFDAGSGDKELSLVFAAAYVVGCILAVLAVRQSSVFTAVIQPPLILFVTVPGAYFLFHGSTFTGLKDVLINCGYPLIERFPLMFFTSAAVLLIGMARWYNGMSTRRTPPKSTAKDATRRRADGSGHIQDVADPDAGTGRGRARRHRCAAPQALHRPAQPGDQTRARPRWQAGQARTPVTLAPRPAAGHRDHRTRGRAAPPAAFRARSIRPRYRRPSRGGGPARHRRVNRASHRRRSTDRPPMSGPSGAVARRGSNPTAAAATARTTRYRGCATAAPTTAMTAFSTGPGAGADTRSSPRPGSTTSSCPIAPSRADCAPLRRAAVTAGRPRISSEPGGSPAAARTPASRWPS